MHHQNSILIKIALILTTFVSCITAAAITHHYADPQRILMPVALDSVWYNVSWGGNAYIQTGKMTFVWTGQSNPMPSTRHPKFSMEPSVLIQNRDSLTHSNETHLLSHKNESKHDPQQIVQVWMHVHQYYISGRMELECHIQCRANTAPHDRVIFPPQKTNLKIKGTD